jgi:hypothetical protein
MVAHRARIVASRRKCSSAPFKEKTFNIADAAVINARFYRLIWVYVAAAGKSMLNFRLLQQKRARR